MDNRIRSGWTAGRAVPCLRVDHIEPLKATEEVVSWGKIIRFAWLDWRTQTRLERAEGRIRQIGGGLWSPSVGTPVHPWEGRVPLTDQWLNWSTYQHIQETALVEINWKVERFKLRTLGWSVTSSGLRQMKWVKKDESQNFYVERNGRIWQKSKCETSKTRRIRSPSGLWSTGKIVEGFM